MDRRQPGRRRDPRGDPGNAQGVPEPGAEEWAIHDYDNFGELRLSESEDIERVAEIGRLISEHGQAFAAYAAHIGEDYATEESFQDAYCGEWESEVAYAEELFDECYAHDIPENLRYYVDYEKFARDLFINDNFSVDNPEGGVWVFHNS
ncbi:MAG: antirestriction protein ArdA [Planctomycetota bacterium]